MFTRLSFSFSRMFRFRNRRAAKTNTDLESTARRSSSGPPPSESRHPAPSQLESINTHPISRPCSLFVHPLPNPTPQSPLTPSPRITPGAPTPIIIVTQDQAQSTLSPVPALLSDVRPQTPQSPPAPKPHSALRVTFQLPTTHTEDPPESPLSMCSTLCDEEVLAEVETAPEDPQEQQLPVSDTSDSGDSLVASAKLDTQADDVVHSGSGRARHVSLFAPLPVRKKVDRFSLPAKHTMLITAASTKARSGRRESKRKSQIFPVSSSGLAKREKRKSRWNQEMDKPETQEVLRVLGGM